MLLGLQSSPVQANICKHMKLDHLYQTQTRAKHNKVFQHLPAYSFQFHGVVLKIIWMNMMFPVLLRSVPHQKSLANPSSAALGNTQIVHQLGREATNRSNRSALDSIWNKNLQHRKQLQFLLQYRENNCQWCIKQKHLRRFSLMCAQRWLNQLVRACCVLDVARFHSIWYQSAPFYKHCTCAD